jgi:hypothetical protein
LLTINEILKISQIDSYPHKKYAYFMPLKWTDALDNWTKVLLKLDILLLLLEYNKIEVCKSYYIFTEE